MFFQEVMTLWQTDITDRHKNVFDEKIVYLVTFSWLARSTILKKILQNTEANALKIGRSISYISILWKEKIPQRISGSAEAKMFYMPWGMTQKRVSRKTYQAKYNFRKRRGSCLPPPPHPTTPILSFRLWGGGD